jgi:HSP20 family protein
MMSRMTPLHPLSTEIAEELRDRFRRMLGRLDEIRSQAGPANTPGIWKPAIDLGELEDAILVRIDLPGVRPDQVKVTLRDQILRIEGKKDRPNPSGGNNTPDDRPIRFLCLERSYGNFAFTLTLKWQIETTEISAQMADGILRIRLPKARRSGLELIIPIKS